MPVPAASPIPPDETAATDASLAGALSMAARSCRQALIDYRSGLLDDGEVRRALTRSGVVIAADEVWLLDTTADRWWRYAGGRPMPTVTQPGRVRA